MKKNMADKVIKMVAWFLLSLTKLWILNERLNGKYFAGNHYPHWPLYLDMLFQYKSKVPDTWVSCAGC